MRPTPPEHNLRADEPIFTGLFTGHQHDHRPRGWRSRVATFVAVCSAMALTLTGVCLVTESPAGAAGSTDYVTSGGTGSCASNSASNGLATIAAALSCSVSGDTISVGPGTFAGGFTISDDVVLRGAGPSTVVTGPFTTGLNEITVADATTVTIEDLAVDGGLGQSTATTNGGILAGSGSLTLAHVSVTDAENLNTGDGGPVYGAVADLPPSGTAADLTVYDSTLANNTAVTTDQGGALVLSSSANAPASAATVVNSTITGNTGLSVGAISANDFGLTVRDSTISGNTGSITGTGGIELLGTSTLTMADTIVASNNVSHPGVTPDCRTAGSSGPLQDGGHNLIGIDATIADFGCGFVNGFAGDLVGTATSAIDPVLGALGHNGGPTETLALLSGSPAIGAGGAADCEASPVNDRDQRGHARRAATRGCDIGAYDTGGSATQTLATDYVTSGGTGSCASNSASNGLATIAAALSCSVSGDTISVGPGTFAGGFTISDDVVLRGAGPSTVVTGPFTTGLNEITVADATTVTIEDLAVDGGLGQSTATTNGGILAGSGSLTLAHVSVTDAENLNTGDGGPVYGAVADLPPSGTAADLTVYDSTLANNTAVTTDQGGALVLSSSANAPASAATVVNSTITGNTGLSVGAISANDFGLTVRDSTISGNTGSITGTGGIELLGTSTLTMADTIVASNNVSHPGVTPDCRTAGSSGPLQDGGHNLIGIDATIADFGCGFVNGFAGDLVGTATSAIDPVLGALGHNGGPTETLALLSGSPAIGAGGAADCEASPVNDRDQRGHARRAATRGCDIGAYDTGGLALPLSVTTRSLPAGTVGLAYSATLAATGGTTPYSWAVTTGTLPPGLSLDASTGTITGVPTAPGATKFTVTLTDSTTPTPKTAARVLSIRVLSST